MDKTTINEKLVPALGKLIKKQYLKIIICLLKTFNFSLDKLKKSKNDLELRMSLLQIY